jgi:hypothetical protein
LAFFNSTISAIMIKKILALAATTLVSFDASADYARYDFSGPVTGYFIQHDDDGSLAAYNIDFVIPGAPMSLGGVARQNLQPQRSEGATVITGATTYFRNNGPTNFDIFSNFGDDQRTSFSVDFSRATQGNFSYTADYSTSRYYTGGYQSFAGTHTGLLTQGTVSASMASNLDFLGGYIEQINVVVPTFIDPNQVPEPGSIALLAIGAIGAAGAARRRKAAQ